MPQRVIHDLSRDECFDLIRQAQVGRLVFQEADGPAALPVNYGVAGEQVVFRLERNSHLRDSLRGAVAFEVDHIDPSNGSGWSVLIRGSAQEIPMEGVPEILRQLGHAFPRPWAEGIHSAWASIVARKVTGRRLTAPYVAELF